MKMPKKLLIIFLHGSGGTGLEIKSFLDTVPLEKLNSTFKRITQEKYIEYICPTALRRSYTPAMGQKLNVWFDRSGNFQQRGVEDKEDIEGADRSVNQVIDCTGYFLL